MCNVYNIFLKFRDYLHSSKNNGWEATNDQKKKGVQRDSPKNLKKHIPRENGAVGLKFKLKYIFFLAKWRSLYKLSVYRFTKEFEEAYS